MIFNISDGVEAFHNEVCSVNFGGRIIGVEEKLINAACSHYLLSVRTLL